MKARALIGEGAVADILKELVLALASGYPVGVERVQALELAL